MAKRSVRKQRRASGSSGATPPTPAATARVEGPPWRTTAFWLGGAIVGLTVAVLAVAGFLLLGGGDDGGDERPAAAQTPAAEDEIKSPEELEQEFAARDKEQVEELTTRAREIAEGLQPVMAGLERALPRNGKPRQTPAQEVDDWLSKAKGYAEPFQESISGDTGHNVARNAVRAALDGLVNAIETYRLASESGAGARAALYRQAARQRDNAIRMWSTAAIQLDAVNIDAGFGHQHIGQLGGPAAGATPPDSLPEGTDAHPED